MLIVPTQATLYKSLMSIPCIYTEKQGKIRPILVPQREGGKQQNRFLMKRKAVLVQDILFKRKAQRYTNRKTHLS